MGKIVKLMQFYLKPLKFIFLSEKSYFMEKIIIFICWIVISAYTLGHVISPSYDVIF